LVEDRLKQNMESTRDKFQEEVLMGREYLDGKKEQFIMVCSSKERWMAKVNYHLLEDKSCKESGVMVRI
jgi:hypothetical protein